MFCESDNRFNEIGFSSLAKDYPMTKHNMSAKYWNVNSNYKKTKNVSENNVFPVFSILC